jgi:hypothetical protein
MSPAEFSNLGLPESGKASINTTPRDFSFDDHFKTIIGSHLAVCLIDANPNIKVTTHPQLQPNC